MYALLLPNANVVPVFVWNHDVTAAVGRPPWRQLVNVGSRHTNFLLGEHGRVVVKGAPDHPLGRGPSHLRVVLERLVLIVPRVLS